MKKKKQKSLKLPYLPLNSLNLPLSSLKKPLIALFVLLAGLVVFLKLYHTVQAVPWPSHMSDWGKRKQITLVNNSGQTLNQNTTYQINIDTKTLAVGNNVMPSCDDLRVFYQPSSTTATELSRSYALASGATDCTTSSSTILSFPLQAAIGNGSTDANYYIYYANHSAPAYSSVTALSAYNTTPGNTTFAAPFNGTTQAVASGSGTPTTATGAIRYSGGKSALSFDGVSDGVSGASLVAQSQLTLEAWINPKYTGSGTWRQILGQVSGSDDGTASLTIREDLNTIIFSIGNANTAANLVTTSVAYNAWSHVAGVYDGSNIKLYVNGVLAQSKAKSAGNVVVATYIGWWGSALYPFRGLIDDVRISNTARYSSNFTPGSAPFVRDSNTLALYHFDENGDDPRNTGKAIDDSGNGNHGTITGAKYVGGLVGVDDSNGSTPYNLPPTTSQSFASHQGVFIEEGTTNKITNPSFENSTFSTNWATSSGVLNYDSTADTFTASMSKRTPPAGPFAAGVMVQGKMDGSGTPDTTTFSRGNALQTYYWYDNFDSNQGSIVMWVTPEWAGNDGIKHILFSAVDHAQGIIYKDTDNVLYIHWGGAKYASADISSWAAGSTHLIVGRWETKSVLSGSSYFSLTVDNSTSFGGSSTTQQVVGGTLAVGSSPAGNYPANALIQGLTIYRRPLYEATTPSGINVGNGDEISQIYNSGTGKDPTLVTGSWDVVFALPTNSSTGALTTGTGNAWSHPHSSNLLYTSTTNTGGFMMNGTYTTDGWSDVGTPTAVAALATANKIFAGGYYATSDAADEGIQRSFAATANANYVIRAIGHSDGTASPIVRIYRADGTTLITSLAGTTTSTRTAPDTYIFTYQAPATENNIVELLNTASSGTASWHQVEVQSNQLSNPSMEVGSGDPWIPTSWGNWGLAAGESTQETTTIHSGSSSVKFVNAGINKGFNQGGTTTVVGKFYDSGGWFKGATVSDTFAFWAINSAAQYSASSALNVNSSGSSWKLLGGVIRGASISTPINFYAYQLTQRNFYVDDGYRYLLDDVSLTVTPASEANSGETTGLRVDGADTLTQTISQLGNKAGTIEFKFTPRHSWSVANKFGSTYPTIAHIRGDSSNQIMVYFGGNDSVTIDSYFNATRKIFYWYSPTLNAGTTYTMKISYDSGGNLALFVNGASVGTPVAMSGAAFSTIPTTIYFGSWQGYADRNYDATFDTAVVSGPTVTQNTTAPYVKFGVNSVSYVAVDPSNYQISINPGNTNSHTLSAYVYNGTSGAVGGTVDGTVASLLWEGAVKTTTYTDMGGGWWRLSYSSTTSNSSNPYGVYVASGKTVYVDGVQLEEKAYATTYADGTLGNGYAWTGTANNSTSTRTMVTLQYPSSNNLNNTKGTISFWFYRFNNVASGETAYLFSDGNHYIRVDSGWGGGLSFNFKGKSTGQPITVTGWHHITISWDDTTSTVQFFLNNSPWSPSGTYSATGFGSYFSVGEWYQPSSALISNSTISDLRIFDRALSSGQVSQLYYAGLGSHQEATTVNRFASPEDPVAYWKLDDGTGTTAKDSSVNQLNGTITGATWQTEDLCVSGKCLKFDGTDDYVDAGTNTAIEPTTALSIASWVKRTGSLEDFSAIFSSRKDSSNQGGYLFTGTSSNKIRFYIWKGSWAYAESDSAINLDQWYHVQGVWDGSTVKLYINGLLQQTTGSAASITYPTTATNNHYVGWYNDTASKNWVGFLDDVKIYNYARTPSQILADYAARSNGASRGATLSSSSSLSSLSNGLVGYWKMDEASWNGTSGEVLDASGNENNGVRVGNATTAAGKFGNGGTFDGTGDYTSVSDSAVFNAANLTYSGWVKFDNITSDAYNALIAKHGQMIFYLPGSSNNFAFYVYGSGGTNCETVNAYSSSNFTNGTWYHFAATYNGKNKKIFVNGSEVASSACSLSGYTDNANSLTFGGVNFDSVYDLDGTIDELRIYNRALSPAEVRQLYNFAPGPVGYWKFDDGSGTSVTDSSGNGYTGTWGGTGSHWTSGKYGKAAIFNGQNDYVNLSNLPKPTYMPITFEFWAKANTTSLTGVFDSAAWSTNVLRIYDPEGGIQWWGHTTATASVTANTWTHIAIIYSHNGTSAIIQWYKNGVFQASSSAAGTSTFAWSGFTLGNINQGGSGWFSGLLDDVKIYNYGRTADQIMEDMLGRTDAGVSLQGVDAMGRSTLINLKMDEGTGTTTKDSSGNQKNGTLNDGPTWSQNGKYNKGITLDGNNDDVSVSDFSY